MSDKELVEPIYVEAAGRLVQYSPARVIIVESANLARMLDGSKLIKRQGKWIYFPHE